MTSSSSASPPRHHHHHHRSPIKTNLPLTKASPSRQHHHRHHHHSPPKNNNPNIPSTTGIGSSSSNSTKYPSDIPDLACLSPPGIVFQQHSLSFSSLAPTLGSMSPSSSVSSYAQSPFGDEDDDPDDDKAKSVYGEEDRLQREATQDLNALIENFRAKLKHFPRCVNILAVGASGVGKSSTLNLIFGSETFPAGHNLESVTQKIEKRSKQYGETVLNLWDSRGFGGDHKDDDVFAELKETILKQDIHCVLFFFRDHRFTALIRENLKRLKQIKPQLMKHTIFVVTHASELPGSARLPWREYYHEKKIQLNKAIFEVIGMSLPICLVETRNPILPDGGDCLTELVTCILTALGNERALAAAIFLNSNKPGVASSLRKFFNEFFDHPLTGAVLGAVVGATVGSVSGPIGAAIGACLGAVFAGTYGATHPFFHRKSTMKFMRYPKPKPMKPRGKRAVKRRQKPLPPNK